MSLLISLHETKIKDLVEVYQALLERKYDIKDLIWELSLIIPANTTVYARIDIPKEIVYFERGYEFDVDKLGVLRFTHYHDGRLIMKDITLDESVLSWRYTRPEICVNYFEVFVTNTDSVDRYVKVVGLYKAIPRELYDRVKV
jgi:hypothetical protein